MTVVARITCEPLPGLLRAFVLQATKAGVEAWERGYLELCYCGHRALFPGPLQLHF